MKSAVSLDGRSALSNGGSQWITGEAARIDGQVWRQRAGAVLTGVGTVRADDPRLDVRDIETQRQPLRVVVDSKLETSPAARILGAPGKVLIYTCNASAASASALRARGAEVVAMPDMHGHVDLEKVLRDLARRGVNELHVEAGETLSGAFVRQALVDEHLIYIAPMLLGQGRSLASIGCFERMADVHRLRFHSVDTVNGDIRVIARYADRMTTLA